MPLDIIDRYPSMDILVDYIYIHGLPHLHFISSGYMLRILEYMAAKKAVKVHCKKGLKIIKEKGHESWTNKLKQQVQVH